jgi:hypothetical protein
MMCAGRILGLCSTQLNHGIELSADGSTLYASSQEAVYAWPYNAESGEVGEARRVIDLGGDGSHSTRTLLLPPNDPDYLLVSWGSNGNVDPQARDPTSGYSTVKAFDISDNSTVYQYATDGMLVGWGLRNSVGLAQNPVTGGLFSNENSVDNLARDGEEIVEDNPAEELVSANHRPPSTIPPPTNPSSRTSTATSTAPPTPTSAPTTATQTAIPPGTQKTSPITTATS